MEKMLDSARLMSAQLDQALGKGRLRVGVGGARIVRATTAAVGPGAVRRGSWGEGGGEGGKFG